MPVLNVIGEKETAGQNVYCSTYFTLHKFICTVLCVHVMKNPVFLQYACAHLCGILIPSACSPLKFSILSLSSMSEVYLFIQASSISFGGNSSLASCNTKSVESQFKTLFTYSTKRGMSYQLCLRSKKC